MSIFILKNYQHREGHTSTIVFTGTLSCPVNITQCLLSLLPGDKDSISSIVRRIVAFKKRSYFHPSLGISYSTARDLFKEHITPFVDVPLRFWTGWKNRLSKRRYVKYSTSDFLEVSRRLGLWVLLCFKDFSPPMSVCIEGEARSRFSPKGFYMGFCGRQHSKSGVWDWVVFNLLLHFWITLISATYLLYAE